MSIWANEQLYIPGNSEGIFREVLQKNLRPIYDSARIQRYEIWEWKREPKLLQ